MQMFLKDSKRSAGVGWLQEGQEATSHWHLEGVRFIGGRILATGQGQHFDGPRGKGASGDHRGEDHRVTQLAAKWLGRWRAVML